MIRYIFNGPGSIRLFILELILACMVLAVGYGVMLLTWAVWG